MKRNFFVSLLIALCATVCGFAIAGDHNQKAQVQKTPIGLSSQNSARITAEIKPHKLKSNIIEAKSSITMFGDRRASDVMNSPSRISPSGATVYGFMSWNIDFYGGNERIYEFREIMTDGKSITSLWDSKIYLSLGFIKDGKLYAYGHDSDAYGVYSTYYGVWDPMTGNRQELKYTDHSNYSNTVLCGAYDSDSDIIYAYTYNRIGSGYMLRTASSVDMADMTTINTDISYDQMCISLAYCPVDRTLYGVTPAGKFVKVNPDDGSVTEVFDTKISLDGNPTAMIYSPADNMMIWNVNYTSGISALYGIDIKAKTCSKIEDWVEEETYSFFTCNDPAVDADAPGNPTLKSLDFPQGATQGSVTYIMPTTTQSGSPIEGKIDYFVLVNDQQKATGSASAAEEVTIDLTLSDGYQSIKCYCSQNGKNSQEIVTDTYIGSDIPLAPQNVKFDTDGIRWDAVTEGVNGGYIDASALTYDVYINDKKAGSSKYPIYAYEFEKGKTIAAYTAKIYAVHKGLLSEPGVSNTIIHGDPYTLPASFTPTATEALIFSTVDQNEDGATWIYNEPTPCFYNFYNYYKDADDWLITPPIKFQSTDHIYEVSLDAASVAGNYTEAFEVYIGSTPTPEFMTKIFGNDNVRHTQFKTYSDIFSIDTAGTYYIGIRATSKAAQYMLMVNNINIRQSERTTAVPDVVTGITTKAASEGELSATVSFVMPTVDMKGNKLNEDNELTATIISPAETLTLTGEPGKRVRTNITTLQGNNTIKIYTENAEGAGRMTEAYVYTGVDTPNYVTGIKSSVSEDNMTIHLTWNAPTIGYNGGYIDSESLTYRICYYSEYVGWTVDQSIAPITTTSFDYVIPKGESLGAYNIGITAVNEAGQCPAVSSIYVVAGEPYSLPMVETFPNGMASCNPMMSWSPTEDYQGSSWFVDDPGKYTASASYDKGSAIVGYGSTAGSKGRLSLAKFSTEGATNPVFTFDYYFRGIDSDILALTYGMSEPIKIGTTSENDTNGWGTMSITLPEQFHDKKWVELYFDATFPVAYTFVVIGQYDITNVVADDVAVTSINGPTVTTIGQPIEFHAVSKVLGYAGAPTGNPACKWSVFNNGQLIEEYVDDFVTDKFVPQGTECQHSFTLNPTVNHVGNLEIVFELTQSDMNNANNKASTNIVVKNDNATIAVTDLRAVDSTDTSISLQWSDLTLNFGNGSFEQNRPFEITPTLSPFKNIDGDGAYLNYFSNWVCPNQGEPAGWVVWNAPQVNNLMAAYSVIGEYTAYDGENFLIAMSPMWDAALGTAPTADDWLISEEIIGGTQVSFQAQPITNVYGAETIEILSSSTTDDISAFSVIATFKIGDPSQSDDLIQWQECRTTLPQDARYFAIRYVSKDIMGIIIDDIKYTSLYDGIEVVGFEVLRDDSVIAENISQSEYIDNTITDPIATYKYNVVPLLNNGTRGSKSNDVYVSPSGVDAVTSSASIATADKAIIIRNHFGKQIVISTLDGKLIASTTADNDLVSINVEPGIYIVKADKAIAKVIIK